MMIPLVNPKRIRALKNRLTLLRAGILTCLTGTLLASAQAQQPETVSAPVPPPSMFRDFVGTCQGSPNVPYLYDVVGWDRTDVYWAGLEPKQGEWKQEELEKWGKKILEMRAKGVKFLPILCYNAPWSWDRAERTYDFGDRKTTVKPGEGDKYIVEKSRRAHNGNWVIESTKQVKPKVLWPLAEEHVAAWENYVRRTVEFLRKPPYNIEYFQIWNEAYPTSGFWGHGDLDSYMKRVHLPAAKIIHDLGGKVVYGGWPCCGTIQDYVALLDRHKAWSTIDVLDIHYFPVSAFEHLHKAAKERGYSNLGIWQTELAFSKDPAFVGNTYPRFLAWCLAHDWSYPDKYRLFFFCASTPDDPKAYGYNRALVQGKELSHHGLSMKTLMDAFSSGKIELYDGVTTKPVLKGEMSEAKSSIESFKVGDKKIVLAIHLLENNDAKIFTDWNGTLETIHLDADEPMMEVNLPKVKADQIASVERVDMAGKRRTLELVSSADGSVKLSVPIRDQEDSPARKWIQNAHSITFLVEANLK